MHSREVTSSETKVPGQVCNWPFPLLPRFLLFLRTNLSGEGCQDSLGTSWLPSTITVIDEKESLLVFPLKSTEPKSKQGGYDFGK